jgi:hypothetical protein
VGRRRRPHPGHEKYIVDDDAKVIAATTTAGTARPVAANISRVHFDVEAAIEREYDIKTT